MNLKKILSYILPLLSGVILYFSWPINKTNLLLFVALIPVLVFIDYHKNEKWNYFKSFFAYYSSTFIWVGFSIAWLYKSIFEVGVFANVINFLLLSLVLPFLTPLLKKNRVVFYAYFISVWVFYNWFHQQWDLSIPFHILGNGFALHPEWIQWYEFTGEEGGTVWILLVNIFLYETLRSFLLTKNKEAGKKLSILSVLTIILPFVLSSLISYQVEKPAKEIEVLLLHPSLDQYQKQYAENSVLLVDQYWKGVESKITPNTDLVVWPETAVLNGGWIDDPLRDPTVIRSNEVLKKYPGLSLLYGSINYKIVQDKSLIEKDNPRFKQMYTGLWYTTHNTSSFLHSGGIEHRSKEIFIPFQEKIPYPSFFGIFSDMIPVVGVVAQLSEFENNKNIFYLEHDNTSTKFTSLLCYESLFSYKLTEYKKQGAQFFVVLANEGWNKDYTGSLQYMFNTIPKAISNRINICRASNYGATCFINPKGEINSITESKYTDAIKSVIKVDDKVTFYSRYPYWVLILSVLITIILSIRLFLTR